jgi:hypothetical protein
LYIRIFLFLARAINLTDNQRLQIAKYPPELTSNENPQSQPQRGS